MIQNLSMHGESPIFSHSVISFHLLLTMVDAFLFKRCPLSMIAYNLNIITVAATIFLSLQFCLNYKV